MGAPAMAMAFRVHVSGLKRSKIEAVTAEDKLKRLFQQEGCTVKEVSLMVDKKTGKSRGFGFVEFYDAASLRRAVRLDTTSQGAVDLEDCRKGPFAVTAQK